MNGFGDRAGKSKIWHPLIRSDSTSILQKILQNSASEHQAKRFDDMETNTLDVSQILLELYPAKQL